jgi:small GTP-binding protein
MIPSYDVLVSLRVLGEKNAGKTSLLEQFENEQFPAPIIGIGKDLYSRIVQIDYAKVKIHAWDTMGSEKQALLRYKNLYKYVKGFLLVYDVTDEYSFKCIDQWMRAINEFQQPAKRILVANKCDLLAERVVTLSRGIELAEMYGIPYFECSARTGQGVNDAFESLAQLVMQESLQNQNDNSGSSEASVSSRCLLL